MQYGHIVEIDLKIPPRPPGYAFVEVSLYSTRMCLNYVVKFVFGKSWRCNYWLRCQAAIGSLTMKVHGNLSRPFLFLSVLYDIFFSLKMPVMLKMPLKVGMATNLMGND